MKRKDKMRAVTRYLISRTGIPLIQWDGSTNDIQGPPPYHFIVTTDAVGHRFFSYLKDRKKGQMSVVIRYDSYIEDIDNAVVGMTLDTFVQLLSSHYVSVQDRVETYIQGD